MKKLFVMIFSMDRACQLEAFLRSMEKYLDRDECGIFIYYKYSNEAFEKGYYEVMKLYPNYRYEREGLSITRDMDEFFEAFRGFPYITFFCDDNLWKAPFSMKYDTFSHFEKKKEIICYSLRMHPGVTKCYSASLNTPPPPLSENLEWNWATLPFQQYGDWAYPMSIDGHIFRMPMIDDLMNRIQYKNVNQIEAFLSANAPKQYPLMMCQQESSIINIPFNRVQTNSPNIHMNVDLQELNHDFLNGMVIDIDIAHEGKFEAPHEEIPLRMIRL